MEEREDLEKGNTEWEIGGIREEGGGAGHSFLGWAFYFSPWQRGNLVPPSFPPSSPSMSKVAPPPALATFWEAAGGKGGGAIFHTTATNTPRLSCVRERACAVATFPSHLPNTSCLLFFSRGRLKEKEAVKRPMLVAHFCAFLASGLTRKLNYCLAALFPA